MIILFVLGLFLSAVYYFSQVAQSVKSASQAVSELYLREQTYHAFKSLLPIVVENLKKERKEYHSLKDPWATSLTFNTDVGSVTINIYDEERFFNLNSIGQEKHGMIFERLLRLLSIDPSYRRALLVWMGKEVGSLQTDYPIKLAPLDSKEELLYMGFRKEDLLGKLVGDTFYPGLWSLTTIHSNGKINVNTADKYILMALDARIDEVLAGKIIQARPFRKVEDLLLVEGFTFDILYNIRDVIDVKSSNFHVVMDFKVGDRTVTYEFVYNMDKDEVVYIKAP